MAQTPRPGASNPKIADLLAMAATPVAELVLPARAQAVAGATDLADLAATLMQSRQTILPKRLMEPGPDAAQLAHILAAASSAPDHGQLLPWRFVLVPSDVRGLLAGQFAAALQQRDAAALPEQLEQAREKAFRSPCLMLLVVDSACGDPDIDVSERLVSAGCAVQNLLLMATAMGVGSALTSGKALKADGLRRLFGLSPSDQALCFVSLGTAHSRKPARLRPAVADFVSHLTPEQGVQPGLGLPVNHTP
jgi:nitroreductase